MSYFDIKIKTEIAQDELKKIKGFFDNQQKKISKFHTSLNMLHGPVYNSKCECTDTDTMFKCIYKYHHTNPPDSFYDLMAEMHNINKEMQLFHSFCEYWRKSVFDPEVGHMCNYEKIQIELMHKNAEISFLSSEIEKLHEKMKNNNMDSKRGCFCMPCIGQVKCICDKCNQMGECEPPSYQVFEESLIESIRKIKKKKK